MSARVELCNLCRVPIRDTVAPRYVKDGHAIIACPVCGLVFRQSLPTLDELAEIYGDSYFGGAGQARRPESYLDYLADEPLHRRAAQHRLRWIGKRTASGGLLDVGAAAGFFVDEARRRGWEAQGLDVAAGMADWARERLSVRVDTATFAAASFSATSFDAITMWDYLEHSLDPRGDVEKAFGLLRPGGLLALSTGDIGSVAARLSRNRWHLLTPRHHNFYFSRRTLSGLLYAAGFNVEGMKWGSIPCSLRYCAHKLQTMTRSRGVAAAAKGLAASRIGDIAIAVNLHDVITVLARKPA